MLNVDPVVSAGRVYDRHCQHREFRGLGGDPGGREGGREGGKEGGNERAGMSSVTETTSKHGISSL
jgi:hypothetical protein